MKIATKDLNKLTLGDLQLMFNNWINSIFPDKELGEQLKARIVYLYNKKHPQGELK